MKNVIGFEEFVINEAKKKKEDKECGLTAGQKKLPKAMQDAILKKCGKKKSKPVEKEDNDKKTKDAPKKGLTAAQKKLPAALQASILKKKK